MKSSFKARDFLVMLGCLVHCGAQPAIAAHGARSGSSVPVGSVSTCSLAALQQNARVTAEVAPDPRTSLVQAPSPATHYISNERRVACSVADLLQLGFELKAAQRHGPEGSTNGAFEEILYLERGSLLVKCYDELTLSARLDSAQVTSSRSACQQVVQSRLRPR